MSTLDLLQVGIGMATHELRLKKYGITPRENILLAYQHKTPPVLPNYLVDSAVVTPAVHIDRYMGEGTGKDGFGVEWVMVPSEGATMPVSGKYILEDITEWKEVVKFPDLDSIDWEKQAYDDLHTQMPSGKRLPDHKTVTDGNKACLCLILNGLFERMHALMGFENALISLLTEPEACHEFFDAVVEYRTKFIKKLKQYYNPDIINFMDDYGTARDLFMSPDTWREMIKPHLQKIIDCVHDLGMIYEHHSCGHIEPLIPEFVEMGVDAIDPLQAACNPNIAELKRKYQDKLTFIGGGDNIGIYDRPGATSAECRTEYRRTVAQLAPGGSYIGYSASCCPAPQVPVLAEHFSYGVKFYKKQK